VLKWFSGGALETEKERSLAIEALIGNLKILAETYDGKTNERRQLSGLSKILQNAARDMELKAASYDIDQNAASKSAKEADLTLDSETGEAWYDTYSSPQQRMFGKVCEKSLKSISEDKSPNALAQNLAIIKHCFTCCRDNVDYETFERFDEQLGKSQSPSEIRKNYDDISSIDAENAFMDKYMKVIDKDGDGFYESLDYYVNGDNAEMDYKVPERNATSPTDSRPAPPDKPDDSKSVISPIQDYNEIRATMSFWLRVQLIVRWMSDRVVRFPSAIASFVYSIFAPLRWLCKGFGKGWMEFDRQLGEIELLIRKILDSKILAQTIAALTMILHFFTFCFDCLFFVLKSLKNGVEYTLWRKEERRLGRKPPWEKLSKSESSSRLATTVVGPLPAGTRVPAGTREPPQKNASKVESNPTPPSKEKLCCKKKWVYCGLGATIPGNMKYCVEKREDCGKVHNLSSYARTMPQIGPDFTGDCVP
jgi:hypothetical protein